MKNYDSKFLGDLLIYFNIAGIVYLVLHSIYLRKMLMTLNHELDANKETPSDYGVLIRNVPLGMSKEELKDYCLKKFPYEKVEVIYVNYLYDI